MNKVHIQKSLGVGTYFKSEKFVILPLKICKFITISVFATFSILIASNFTPSTLTFFLLCSEKLMMWFKFAHLYALQMLAFSKVYVFL